MQKLLLTILATLVDLMYFTMVKLQLCFVVLSGPYRCAFCAQVLVLFVFLYAMAAKQMFSGKMVTVVAAAQAPTQSP